MAKPELGLKRTCVACGTKFYDLIRAPAICPKCGIEQPAEQPRPRRTGGGLPAEDRKKRAVVPEAETEGVELGEVEADEAVEETEELEDEAETIDEEIEVDAERDEET